MTRRDRGAALVVVSVAAIALAAGCNAITGASRYEIGSGGGAGGAGAQGTGGATGTGAGATTGTTTTGTTTGTSTTTSSTTGTTTSTSSTTSTSTTGTGPSNDPAQLCVDEINKHRASIGLPPYSRWTSAEACASDEAMKDSIAMMAHSAFNQCGELAQNECPGWGGTPESIIANCLQQMWNEGPGDFNAGHGHYINMSSTQYTQVACGFYVTANGSVWATQDFQ